MAGFTIDLAGRVKNFNLPKKKPLIPLFEAIVNSIYAIEEGQEKGGKGVGRFAWLKAFEKTEIESVNKNIETIATKIMQHCMIYLMFAKCPKIVVVDEEKYDISAMFETRVKREENSKEILLGNEKFHCFLLKSQTLH